MNWYDAMEEAYKKGYDKGQEDARKNVRHGRWIHRGSGKETYVECSWCHVCGSPQWKVCPVCETKMDIVIERSCEICANDGMDIPQCKECPGNGFLWFSEKV